MAAIPKPKLVPEWRKVMLKAWSVRFIVLAFVLSAAVGVFTLMPELAVPFVIKAGAIILSPIADMAAFLVRPIAQDEIHDD